MEESPEEVRARGLVPFLHPALRPEREEEILAVPVRSDSPSLCGSSWRRSWR